MSVTNIVPKENPLSSPLGFMSFFQLLNKLIDLYFYSTLILVYETPCMIICTLHVLRIWKHQAPKRKEKIFISTLRFQKNFFSREAARAYEITWNHRRVELEDSKREKTFLPSVPPTMYENSLFIGNVRKSPWFGRNSFKLSPSHRKGMQYLSIGWGHGLARDRNRRKTKASQLIRTRRGRFVTKKGLPGLGGKPGETRLRRNRRVEAKRGIIRI